jgi:hypothetical protein
MLSLSWSLFWKGVFFFKGFFPTIQFSAARWFVFKPKILIWVNFGRSCHGSCFVYFIFIYTYIYFMAIWYILWSLVIFLPVLVCCAEKNLATLIQFSKLVKNLSLKRVLRLKRPSANMLQMPSFPSHDFIKIVFF